MGRGGRRLTDDKVEDAGEWGEELVTERLASGLPNCLESELFRFKASLRLSIGSGLKFAIKACAIEFVSTGRVDGTFKLFELIF